MASRRSGLVFELRYRFSIAPTCLLGLQKSPQNHEKNTPKWSLGSLLAALGRSYGCLAEQTQFSKRFGPHIGGHLGLGNCPKCIVNLMLISSAAFDRHFRPLEASGGRFWGAFWNHFWTFSKRQVGTRNFVKIVLPPRREHDF